MNVRWAVKRCLKWAVCWGTAFSGLGTFYRFTRSFRQGYRILTYHKISDWPEDSFTVKTAHFLEHAAYLSDNAEVIALGEMARRIKEGLPSSHLTVAVTFDDGYREHACTVREILEKYRIPASFFVVTGILDREGEGQNSRFINWQDARELAQGGFDIGSHTANHVSLGGLTADEVRQELVTSRSRITEELGIPPRAVSYPFGTVRDFSSLVVGAVEEAGYELAVTSVNGLNRAGSNLFTLQRTGITWGDGPQTFRMILNGNLDLWELVDRWAYRFQRSSTEKWEKGY